MRIRLWPGGDSLSTPGHRSTQLTVPIPTVSHSLLPQRVPCKPRRAHKPSRTRPSSTCGTGTAPRGGTRP
nr:MAG TPA: hypothetical protein [Caudoviricetes sp.]